MASRSSVHHGRGLRVRTLLFILGLTLTGLALAGVATFSVMMSNTVERVDRELLQEIDELEAISELQTESGSPFTSVTALLETATESAVPSQSESVLALVNGKPKFRPALQDFELTTPEVLGAIRDAEADGSTVLTTVHSPIVGDLRVAIASVEVSGDSARGTFVVAHAIEQTKGIVATTAWIYALVSTATLIVMGVLAWVATGTLLQPLERLTHAVEDVSADNLSHRVPPVEGQDEIAILSRNFNLMLDRIDEGYETQRQFLRDAGHELRTPITIVSGTIEMLDPADEDFDESKEIALDELERMGRIVGDLSTLARSDAPTFVQPEVVDLEAFSQALRGRLTKLAERPWNITGDVAGTAHFDRQRMMQALVQLSANAVAYSPEGTAIDVSVRALERGAELFLGFAVRDRGKGLSQEDQVRVFERFVRIDTHATAQGSGLGLPIVKAIAEAHRGRVEVESAVGHGATFTILIPFTPDDQRRSPTPSERPKS